MKNFCYSRGLSKEDTLLRLIDISDNRNCWFQCLHSYSTFYKTPLQIMTYQVIIHRLMPLDASMIGIVCGEKYNEYLKKMKSLPKPFKTEQRNETSTYKLTLIGRDGTIEYEASSAQKFYEKNILDLIKKKDIIKRFSAYDAYYLGFLTGLKLSKIKLINLNLPPDSNTCHLKLVAM